MDEHDYFFEYGETPNLNTPDQVEYLQTRLFNIMAAQHTGFGLDGRGRNEEALTWSQMILDDLLVDLKRDELSPAFEYDDGTKINEDLMEFALFPLAAIAAAPNLERRQKIKLLADYPDLLLASGFTFTKYGARSRVSRNLRECGPYISTNPKEHRSLIKTVEQQWRKKPIDITLRILGSAAIYHYLPKIIE